MRNAIRFTSIIILSAIVLGLNLAQASTGKAPEQQGTLQETVSADGVIQVVAFEKDLDRLVADAINGQLKGYIKSATVKIYDGYLEVTAIAQKPITATLFVRASITAENGKLYPKFLKMRYGFLPIPGFLMNFLVGKLVGQNSQNFQSAGVEMPGLEWQSVDLKEGEATVKFKETDK